MISDKMAAELNKQINAELYSAYLYASMSGYAADEGLNGISTWFSAQAQEEVSHAQKFYAYMNSQGKRVILEAIDKPPADFDGATGLFEGALEHEQKVTALINGLVDTARDDKDHATEIFLQWFVTEQVEEEENVNEILGKLKLAGDKGGGLFMIDRELGTRTFTPSAAEDDE